MNTPEQNTPPIQPSENEPSSKGFQIRVEKPDLIFKATQQENSGEIGQQLLESPIEKVDVQLEAGKGTFNLMGVIQFDFKAVWGGKQDQDAIQKKSQKKFQKLALIIKSQKEEDILLLLHQEELNLL